MTRRGYTVEPAKKTKNDKAARPRRAYLPAAERRKSIIAAAQEAAAAYL